MSTKMIIFLCDHEQDIFFTFSRASAFLSVTPHEFLRLSV